MEFFSFKTVLLWFLLLRVGSSVSSNIALTKPTMESSTRTHMPTNNLYEALNAVDGIHQAYVMWCASTDLSGAPTWWMVDLLHVYNVQDVVIYNRDYQEYLLDNLYIEGFLHYPVLCPNVTSQLCGSNPGPSGLIVNITCSPGFQARYLRINSPGDMVLCEVEVYGPKVETGCSTRSILDKVPNTSLTNTSLLIENTESRISCSLHCHLAPLCLFFSYNSLTKECLVTDQLITSDELLPAAGWDFFLGC